MNQTTISESLLIAPVTRPIGLHCEALGGMGSYWLMTFKVALAAALQENPEDYIGDVLAHAGLSFYEYEDQVAQTCNLMDVIFNEYADYIERLRERHNHEAVLFNVRDVQYSERHWSCMVQTIYTA